jgi:diguanylate cyclase (GGDEF)-like protein
MSRPSKLLLESHRLCYGPVIRLVMLTATILSFLFIIPEYFTQKDNYVFLAQVRICVTVLLFICWQLHSRCRCQFAINAAAFAYVLTTSIGICVVGRVLHEGSSYIMPYSVLLALLPGLLSIEFYLFIPCLLTTIFIPVVYLLLYGCSASEWVMFAGMLLIAALTSVLLFTSNRRILTGMYGLVDTLRDAAGRDPLTGLCNRSSWYRLAQLAYDEAVAGDSPLAILYIDIDFFKSINDRYGHVQGDAVLRALSTALQDNLRAGESIARFGGEEFVVLLPHVDLDGAFSVAQRLHQAMQQLPGIDCRVTISVGAAEYLPGESLDQLISRADSALLQAKGAGRNQTCLAHAMCTQSLF